MLWSYIWPPAWVPQKQADLLVRAGGGWRWGYHADLGGGKRTCWNSEYEGNPGDRKTWHLPGEYSPNMRKSRLRPQTATADHFWLIWKWVLRTAGMSTTVESWKGKWKATGHRYFCFFQPTSKEKEEYSCIPHQPCVRCTLYIENMLYLSLLTGLWNRANAWLHLQVWQPGLAR